MGCIPLHLGPPAWFRAAWEPPSFSLPPSLIPTQLFLSRSRSSQGPQGLSFWLCRLGSKWALAPMKLPRMEEGAEGSKEAPANPQLVLPHHAPRHPQISFPALPTPNSLVHSISGPHIGHRVRVASLTVGTVIPSSPVPCPSLSWEVASKRHPSSLAHLFQSVQTPHLRHKKDHFPPVKSKGQQSRAPRCPHRSQCQALDSPSTPRVPEHCFLPGPPSLPGPSHQHLTLPTLFTQPLQALSGPLTGLCCDKQMDSGVRDRKFKSVSLSLETEARRQQLGTWEPALTSPGAWADPESEGTGVALLSPSPAWCWTNRRETMASPWGL